MKYTFSGKKAFKKVPDALERLPSGSAVFSGPLINALDFVEKKSLLDPELWAIFVDQFRQGDVDVHDLGWRGEYWGKMMRGACITYEYNVNEKLYSVLEATVRDILTTADSGGRIATYTVQSEFHGWDVWCRKYVMLGLEYFLEICRDGALAEQIVAALRGQADYLVAKTGCGEPGKTDITYTSEWWEGLNASSVLEPIVRLYEITGDKKYLDYAFKIVACGGMRPVDLFKTMLEGKTAPYELPVTKAYEMMSNFEGIIELYRVTGNEDYRTMALNFAELVQKTDITVIGSAGTTHELFDHSAVRQFDPAFTGIMQETCVTVTWMKFCAQLLKLTGDARFADRIEISAYNALLGAVNFNENPFNGEVFAFDSYSPLLNSVRGLAVGGYKTIRGDGMHWGCCVAIGAAGTGLFPCMAVMKKTRGIAVNFYLRGKVTADVQGKAVGLEFDTDYPYAGGVTVTVDPGEDAAFDLLLRIPNWSSKTDIQINGAPARFDIDQGYAKLARVWHKGDKVSINFDMRTRVLHAADVDPDADEKSVNHFALLRGPLVLARDESMGHDLDTPVTVKESGGFAAGTELPAQHGSMLTAAIATSSGPVEVCDYASCGRDWRNGKRMTAWIISGK